jgi:hypothetical protein
MLKTVFSDYIEILTPADDRTPRLEYADSDSDQGRRRTMKKFYFVGGPKLDQSEEFFRYPVPVGKMPSAWRIYPRTPNEGKDSSAAKFEPQGIVWNRLLHFDGASEWSQIVVIAERMQ